MIISTIILEKQIILKPLQATSATFRDIIENGFLYVDKTRYLYELLRYGKSINFVSRPRRFGKSLAVSTLAEICQGEKELFQGLWIYDSDYEWKSYPIIRIDFGRQTIQNAEQLKKSIEWFLDEIATQYNLTLNGFDYQSLFSSLITQLAEAHNGKVVLLIDEYDKPIVNNMDDIGEAIKIRDVLRAFYGVAKAMDAYWRFIFITGTSKFSGGGVFSTMNNLDDLTMDYRFADALGITEVELRHYFQEHIDALAQRQGIVSDELLVKICHWYGGFRFAPEGENLHNPYSMIQLFQKKRFHNYWFATGTPNFLIKLLRAQEYSIESLRGAEVDELALSSPFLTLIMKLNRHL